MFFKLKSAALNGLDCTPVEIEVDINKGQTFFDIVGLPDASIQESKSRIHSAIKNSGFQYPFNFRIVVNLAPADLRKEGSVYDLPMAVGIIAISNKLDLNLNDSLIVGELALNGELRHTGGILPLALFAKQQGFKNIYIPSANAKEASLAKGLMIYPIENLRQLIDHLTGKAPLTPYTPSEDEDNFQEQTYPLDMAFIKGQEFAKRALEIAASGGHNILMSGPPGSGKTLLARSLPSILPKLTLEEALEITKIYSVAGLLRGNFAQHRPFRSPHHTASGVSLVGGGKNPRPGEISLSHRGVLFLDELPEFPRVVLENLRQPLEDGTITISRAHGTFTFPAKFILVASQNPCPCGYSTDPDRACVCSPMQIIRYRNKISGPLLDRVDLHIEVPRVEFDKLISEEKAESSTKIRERVEKSRKVQNERFKDLNIFTNGEMGGQEIRKYCKLDEATKKLLKGAVEKMRLSARAYNRILKLSRTIADLEGKEQIELKHTAEALQYRPKEE